MNEKTSPTERFEPESRTLTGVCREILLIEDEPDLILLDLKLHEPMRRRMILQAVQDHLDGADRS